MINATMQAILLGVLVYAWTLAVPALIRPIYTWQGSNPPVQAIAPLQKTGWILAVLAIVIGVARAVLEHWAAGRPAMVQRLTVLRASLVKAKPSRVGHLPLWADVILKASLTTLVLSGILETWLDAVGTVVVLALIITAREGILPALGRWTRLARAPLLVRLVAGVAVSYYLGLKVLETMWHGSSSFRPILIGVIVSLIVFTLLLPGRGTEAQSRTVAPPEKT